MNPFIPRNLRGTSGEKKSAMQEIAQEKIFKPPALQLSSHQNLGATNMRQEKFFFELKTQVDPADPSVAFVLTLTPQVGQKKRFLDIDGFYTQLLDYAGTDFPSVLKLYCLELDGQLGNDLNPSHFLAESFSSLKSVNNIGGINAYSVQYRNQQDEVWDITNIPTLTFKIYTDNPAQPPIPFPTEQVLYLKGKIVRVIV